MVDVKERDHCRCRGDHGNPAGGGVGRQAHDPGVALRAPARLCHALIREEAPTGKVNSKVAPCGAFAVAHRRPLWASMIERQIDRPMPMPLGLVVKKAVNNWSVFSTEKPGPQSVPLTRTCCASS